MYGFSPGVTKPWVVWPQRAIKVCCKDQFCSCLVADVLFHLTQRVLVCIISQHDNNVLLGTQSLKLSAFTHMFAFDPGKPGIIRRLRGDKWLTSGHPDCGVNGAGVGAVVAESRFQIRTMWLPNLFSYLIPSNPISWFKDWIQSVTLLSSRGASIQVSLIALH